MGSKTNTDDAFAVIEKAFSDAVRDGVLPGAVLAATNGSGSFHFAHGFGNNEINNMGKPLTTKSIMAIASMTKLMTSIAALQLVERQLVHLDQDISPMIPNLAAQEILTSWDTTGRYTTDKRKNAITLRSLLTHSSGAGYDMSNPGLAMVTKSQGRKINVGATVNERFDYPLLFEPGTGWEYGTGIDWVGQLVECLTGQDLESYMQEYIWNPLEIQKITFWPFRRIDMNAERMQMTVRDATSGRIVPLQKPFLTEGVSECFGGQGAYAAMEDFMKILRSILADDGKLLTEETTAMMFQPQLGDVSSECLRKNIRSCGHDAAFIGITDNSQAYDWGLGGMLAMEDESSGRKKGTLFWSGKPNLFWVSRKKNDTTQCDANIVISLLTDNPIFVAFSAPKSFHLEINLWHR